MKSTNIILAVACVLLRFELGQSAPTEFNIEEFMKDLEVSFANAHKAKCWVCDGAVDPTCSNYNSTATNLELKDCETELANEIRALSLEDAKVPRVCFYNTDRKNGERIVKRGCALKPEYKDIGLGIFGTCSSSDADPTLKCICKGQDGCNW